DPQLVQDCHGRGIGLSRADGVPRTQRRDHAFQRHKRRAGRQALRHEADQPGAVAHRNMRKVAAVKDYLATIGLQLGDGAQQRGLSCGVRSGQHSDFARAQQWQIQPRQHIACTVADRDILCEQPLHQRRLPRRISAKKIGNPIREVTSPTGSSTPGTSVLLSVEASDITSAPVRMLAGRKTRWFSPTSMRAICGPARPTKPITPTIDTAEAASRLTLSSVQRLSPETSTPTLRACASPSRSAVSLHAARKEKGTVMASTSASISTPCHCAEARLPMVQNTSCCSASAEATNCSSDSSAAEVKFRATPKRIRTSGPPPR